MVEVTQPGSPNSRRPPPPAAHVLTEWALSDKPVPPFGQHLRGILAAATVEATRNHQKLTPDEAEAISWGLERGGWRCIPSPLPQEMIELFRRDLRVVPATGGPQREYCDHFVYARDVADLCTDVFAVYCLREGRERYWEVDAKTGWHSDAMQRMSRELRRLVDVPMGRRSSEEWGSISTAAIALDYGDWPDEHVRFAGMSEDQAKIAFTMINALRRTLWLGPTGMNKPRIGKIPSYQEAMSRIYELEPTALRCDALRDLYDLASRTEARLCELLATAKDRYERRRQQGRRKEAFEGALREAIGWDAANPWAGKLAGQVFDDDIGPLVETDRIRSHPRFPRGWRGADRFTLGHFELARTPGVDGKATVTMRKIGQWRKAGIIAHRTTAEERAGPLHHLRRFHFWVKDHWTDRELRM
ncbi:MAG: hypothetical protein AAB152_18915 [Candidatus Coatesbacteria bacterium]